MTCIVGFVDKGTIYMGADSAGVGGYHIRTRSDEKVLINDKFIIGYTSSYRMGQLLRFSLTVPKKTEGQDDYDYMCTTFINAVIKCFKDNGFATIKDGVIQGGIFLVGYNSKLYQVESDFQVGKMDLGYDSCGCGDPYALGAFHMIHNKTSLSPEEKITLALETAEEFSAGVRSPFVIINNKDD